MLVSVRDGMHGLNTYDYGARQYNPITARWDRVDPHSENYYPHSQYAYCNNTPMNAIDPDGKDDYRLNAAGQFEFWRKTNAKTTDRIYTLDGKSNITINNTTTKQLMSDRDDYYGNYAEGGSELQDLFKFCSDNSNVEWSLNGYKNKGKTTYLIATSHKEGKVYKTNGENNELDLFVSIHSHPGDSPAKASGYGKNSVQGKKLVSTGDDQFNVNDVYLHFNNAGKAYPSQYPRFYIYHTKTQTRIGYAPDSPRTSVKKIRKASDLIQ
jgi:RHS repeat-associated protein